MAKLDPIVSEVETEEDAASYDAWFRAKVEAALADTRPGIPHDEVAARLHRARKKSRAAARLSLHAP